MRCRFVVVVALASLSSTAEANNVAHEQLAKLEPSAQAAFLGKVVGEGCQGTRAYLMGLGKRGAAKEQAFWSVQCSDGRSFAVMISPDARGTTQVLDCAVLKAVGGGVCFEKLKD